MQLTQLHHYAQIIKLFCVEKKGVLTVGNFILDYQILILSRGIYNRKKGCMVVYIYRAFQHVFLVIA